MGSDFRKDIYAERGRSVVQRAFLTMGLGLGVGVAWWLLVGGGLVVVGRVMGWSWSEGDGVRRVCLGVALSVYFVRLLFTQFVFLKRAVSWGEVGAIVPWVLAIYLVLSISGGRNGGAFGWEGWLGVVLFGVGSWMNSYAEYERHRWKQRVENRGRLYTEGLFRYTRHPNYLGDVISFSGVGLMAGRWVTVVVPVLMLVGFVFVNIPMLDRHLHEHYGESFEAMRSGRGS